MVSPTEI